MVEMTAVHHDAADGYTLIELPDDTAFGWSARSHGEPPYRYILPDILVEEEGIAEIEEISSMDLPLAGVLSLCPALDKIYAEECEKHDARVAVPTNHYELPHDVWISESSVLGTVEFDIWESHGRLRTSHGSCRFPMHGGPADLRLAIRDALRNMTGQKNASLNRPPAFVGPSMTSIAAWVLGRMRPYAAEIYTSWINRALERGYPEAPLVFGRADVAGPCDRAEMRFSKGRLTCTIDMGDIRFCEEVVTTPSCATTELSKRKGMQATALLDHPALEGRTIVGTGYTERRSIHSLDRINPVNLLINLDGIPFTQDEANRICSDALEQFEQVTAGARLAIARMETSERVSRLDKIARRMISETPWQDPRTHDLRLITNGRRLEADGPLASGVFWRRGALRIENLPASSCHAILRSGKGKPLRNIIELPGMEDAIIQAVSRVPEGKRRPEQLIIKAA